MKLKLDYKWVALTVTTLGSFMANLDTSIVVIGLPSILEDLNANITHGIWIITGYRLAMTLFLVLFGRLSDIFGRVRLYNIGFAGFTLGSLFCGLSTSGELLVISRLFQGVGAALIFANSAAIVTDAFPPEELGVGLGTNMMASNLGTIAGYSLSGVMIALWGWRSIFLVNVPIGIFATIWGYRTLKETVIKPVKVKFDYAGSALYTTALCTVLYAITIGKPLSPGNLAILGVGFILFIGVVLVETRQKEPMLDLNLFKIRIFAAGNLTGFFNSLAYNCFPFIQSLYLQLVMGFSATDAGAMLIPLNLVVFIFSPVSGKIADKYGSRWLSSAGLALCAAALFVFASFNRNTTYTAVLFGLILFGFGRAMFTSPNTSAVMGCVPAEKRGLANGVRSTVNQTGNVLSVPFSLILMAIVMPYDQLTQIVSSAGTIQAESIFNTFIGAISFACLVLGAIMVIAIIPSMLRGSKTELNGTLKK